MREVKEVEEHQCPEREEATIKKIVYTDGSSEVSVSGDCWGCEYFSVWMKCTKYEKRTHE